jgi:hypothetical protein
MKKFRYHAESTRDAPGRRVGKNTGNAPCRRVVKNNRSGYALLFIYMMAATIAVMLYMQLPRVAFESQRDKEQLLIDRGEQYKRAIQLYVRKFNRFPADMQALENTQNIRFLRKQYSDPMTGKSEWRLIHVGPNGALTDSKISGANQQTAPAAAPQTLVADLSMSSGPSATQGINQAARRRPSDDGGTPGGGGTPGDPNNPGASNGPVMVLPDGRIVPATSTGVPALPGPTNIPNNNAGGPLPGQPGTPFQPGQAAPSGGFQNTPNTPPGGAAGLINQILTTPRPGGFNGTGGTPTDPSAGGGVTTSTLTGNNTGTPLGQTMGGTTVGGGIAGVASKLEQEGIKVYNKQNSYDKWEFVYDMSKDKTRGGGANVPAQPQTNPAQPQGSQPAQPAASPSPTPVTGTPGTGSS